jgi:Cu+-exporting ATPase
MVQLQLSDNGLLIDNIYSQIYLATATQIIARFDIADQIKRDSLDAIISLKKLGLQVIMLTGDNQVAATEIAKHVAIDEVYANCKPADKIAKIRKLQSQENHVVFVGDGINDAPSLAAADIGIAIGNGTDIARQSAAISLMRNSLFGVSDSILLARQINKNMRQNLFGSFIYNSIAVLVAAGVLYPTFGTLLNPMIASVVMSLSSVSVIGNSLRLRFA